MNITQNQLRVHVPVIGWLYILGNACTMLTGIFIFLLLGSIGVFIHDKVALPILGTIGMLIGLLCVTISLPGLAAGIGLLARKHWGRILAIVVAILSLVSFPLGTIVGVYALLILLQDEATEYFNPQSNA